MTISSSGNGLFFLSKVSIDNSSTTALNNGQTFTGEWEDTTSYDSIIVAISTDQDGVYYIDYSPDGTNVDSTLTRYYNTPGINAPHRFTNTRRFFRVRFTNDSGSNQTYFRLQVVLKVNSQNLNIPLDGIMSRDYDAISVRSTDYTTEVAQEIRQGHTTWNKFGYNEDVDTTNPEIIAAFGGAFNQRLGASGETLNISSSSSSDASGGTGVITVVIFGVDGDWNPVTEVVSMNGTNTVTTTNAYQGVNRMTIFQSGSSNSNVGLITATASSSGNTMATMPAGQGTTQQCLFYVPDNHKFLATWLYLNAIKSSGGGSPAVTFYGYVYSNVVDSQFEIYRDSIDTSGGGERIELKPGEPFVVGERSILWFEAATTANNTYVRGRFSGKLIKDADAD